MGKRVDDRLNRRGILEMNIWDVISLRKVSGCCFGITALCRCILRRYFLVRTRRGRGKGRASSFVGMVGIEMEQNTRCIESRCENGYGLKVMMKRNAARQQREQLLGYELSFTPRA